MQRQRLDSEREVRVWLQQSGLNKSRVCGSVQKGSWGNQVKKPQGTDCSQPYHWKSRSASQFQVLSFSEYPLVIFGQCHLLSASIFSQNRHHAGLVTTDWYMGSLVNFSVCGDTLPSSFVLNVVYQF